MSVQNIINHYRGSLNEFCGVDKNNVRGRAIFSKQVQSKRRYFLEKRWSDGDKVLTAFMMNPSKATHLQGDDTVNQIMKQAKESGYDALYIVNMSPKVEGTSGRLKMSDFDFDQINWDFIKEAIDEAEKVFISWGMKGQKGLKRQIKQKRKLSKDLASYKSKYVCYELKKSASKNKYDPKFYVPHPRPWFKKNRYIDADFLQLNEFNKVFPY